MSIWEYNFLENYRQIQNCWYREDCDRPVINGQIDSNCIKNCKKFEVMHRLIGMSGLTKKQQKTVKMIDNSPEANKFINELDISDFIQQGDNLYIYGNPGTGKTSWAIKILMNYFDIIATYKTVINKRWGIFLDVPLYLADCKMNINYPDHDFHSMQEDLRTAPLVIWDDIGANNPSNFDYENLFAVINYRINAGLSNIFTSNLNDDLFLEIFGARLTDRIWGNSTIVEIKGKSMRGILQNG